MIFEWVVLAWLIFIAWKVKSISAKLDELVKAIEEANRWTRR